MLYVQTQQQTQPRNALNAFFSMLAIGTIGALRLNV